MTKSRFTSLLMLGGSLFGLMASPAMAQTKPIEMQRQTFQPNYWEDTDHGQATLSAANVLSTDGSDIAFAALNDTLAMSTGVSNPVAGYFVGKGMSELTNAIKDTDKQFARLAKFPGIPATYLQYDGGDWCIISGPGDLDHIERDSLEPMTRFDIPQNAGAQVCRSPDGFYEDKDGKVFYFYSSHPQDKSWYGIGFGDSLCLLANPTDWQTAAYWAFPNDRDKGNLCQGTKFKLHTKVDGIARGRTYKGTCSEGTPSSYKIKLSADQQEKYRGILFNDHWISTGHGASLFYEAKAQNSNAIGDVLTSDTAGFLAGFSDSMSFYGTGSTILSQMSAEDVTFVRMAKRPNHDAVYLQQDNGAWCFMADHEQLSIMKADEVEVHRTNNIPSNVQAGRTQTCGWPDGFYKVDNDNVDQVFYLYTAKESEPTWYGIGLGSSYCRIRNEPQWRNLIGQAGGNAGSPQDSLHRISDLDFLKGRTEVANCPTRIVNGVMVN